MCIFDMLLWSVLSRYRHMCNVQGIKCIIDLLRPTVMFFIGVLVSTSQLGKAFLLLDEQRHLYIFALILITDAATWGIYQTMDVFSIHHLTNTSHSFPSFFSIFLHKLQNYISVKLHVILLRSKLACCWIPYLL